MHRPASSSGDEKTCPEQMLLPYKFLDGIEQYLEKTEGSVKDHLDPCIELALAGGRRVRIGKGADEETL